MAASAGTVTLELDANSVKLLRDLKKSQRATQKTATKMQSSMTKSFGMIKKAAAVAGAAVIAFATRQLAVMVRSQLALAGNLQRVAETVGFTTEQVQALRFAAGQLNLKVTALDMGLQRFSRRMGEVAQGTGEALKVVIQYGVAVKDSSGRMRSNIDILRDFSDVIASVSDEQEQLRIAFKLFDSEGAGFVRLMRRGAKGLDEFMERAKVLGVVVGDDLVAAAAEADRVFNQIKQTLDAKMMAAVAGNADELERMAEALGSIKSFGIGAASVMTNFIAGIGTAIGGLRKGLENILGKDRGDAFSEVVDKLLAAKLRLRGLKEASSFRADIASSLDKDIIAVTAEIERLEARWAFLRKRAVDAHRANIRENLAAAAAGRKVIDKETPKVIKEINLAMLAFICSFETAQQKAARLIATLVTFRADIPAEEFKRIAQAINDDLVRSLEKTEVALDEVNDANEELQMTFQSAFEDAIVNGNKFRDVLKGIYQDILRIMVRKSITEPLGNAFANFFGKIFGGPQAHGGPVTGGTSYMVGEKGPELFTPGASGVITPNHKLGGGVVIYNSFEAGVDMATVMSEVIPLLEATQRSTIAEIALQRREGIA